MPVTVIPAAHQPRLHPREKPATSREEFLKYACPGLFVEGQTRCKTASIPDRPYAIYPSDSSFIRSAVEAWARHSHFVLRPDEVWFSMLVQMNFFMEKHSESIRHIFVSHDRKKAIEIWDETYDEVIRGFRGAIAKRINVDWMADWIRPGFTTTTIDDETTATVLLMGLMKGYFEYSGGETCGIPSITLLGEQTDWQRLLEKTERFADFGDEPRAYAARLRPILTRMIATFDTPTGDDTRSFWDQMVQSKVLHRPMCGRPESEYVLSGWILGFEHWDNDGSLLGGSHVPVFMQPEIPLVYDGVSYEPIMLERLPVAYAKATFTMLNRHPGPDPSKSWKGFVIAGNIAKRITDGAPEGVRHIDGSTKSLSVGKRSRMRRFLRKERRSTDDRLERDDIGHSTIQPYSAWMLCGPDVETFRGAGHWDGVELWGPTVDAIKSCDGIEHVWKH